jgi:general nucleoside transport system permease protein
MYDSEERLTMTDTWFRKIARWPGVAAVAYSLLAIVIAVLIGAVIIHVSGYDVGRAYTHFWRGAFGSSYNLAQSLLKTIPLIFTGLAVAIGFRSGLFNIGGEGQMYWGALAAAVTALQFARAPGPLLIALALLAAALAGAAWGAIPGYLKARTGAHEVVTTIMLNYIGILATTLLLKRFFNEPGPVDQTPLIPQSARLPELVAHTRLTWGIVIAVVVVVLIDRLLNTTSLGYDLRAVGQNPGAAEYAGINVRQTTVISMSLSGAMAGLGGGVLVLGILNRFITNFSPGYGFTGIAVAVLGRNAPWGVLLAAGLFGVLDAGGLSMQLFAKIPMDLMTIV